MNPKIGFWLCQTATEFEPACIAQLIQVELLRRHLTLAQIQGCENTRRSGGPSQCVAGEVPLWHELGLPNSQLLNSFVYMTV